MAANAAAIPYLFALLFKLWHNTCDGGDHIQLIVMPLPSSRLMPDES